MESWGPVFERFSDRSRYVLVLAHEEAGALGHGFVGTEHVLLGLLREDRSIAARVLRARGVNLDAARAVVATIVGSPGRGGPPNPSSPASPPGAPNPASPPGAPNPASPPGAPNPASPPFTPRAKKVLELAVHEALQSGEDHVEPEHLLLALIGEGGGVACQVLVRLGVPPQELRPPGGRARRARRTTRTSARPFPAERRGAAPGRPLVGSPPG